MRDLGSRAAMRWGSSPHARTSVGAKSVRLRFRQQPEAFAKNCAHFLAPPSKSEALGFGFVFFFFADFVSLATAFFRSEQTPSRTHSAAPPFQIEPAALGFNLGFYFCAKSVRLRFRQQPMAIAVNCAYFLAPPSKSEALGFGFVFIFRGLRIVRDGIEHLGTIGTNKPATAPQMRCRCRFCSRLKNSYTRVLYGLSRASR